MTERAPTSRFTVVMALMLVGVIAGVFGIAEAGVLDEGDDHSEQVLDADGGDDAAMTHDHEGSMDSEAMAHDHNRDYDVLWAQATDEERAAATKLVEDTKSATAVYQDYDAALAAGYRPNPQGGVTATHHPNPSLMRDGRVLDPSAPESLMYWTAPDGAKVLVGVVYKAAPWEEAPAPAGALTVWHTHAGGTMCHPAEDAECPQDTGKMLHVFFFDGVRDPFTESMAGAAGGRAAFVAAMRQQVS
jgi:hypothetical protein